ncbi:hypothetical protein DU472_02250 [Campylobacter novaezeelandiae]|uniref:Uncharacterized protein n=1 Tax=Campylobacter novaezeelandiae TaxID=2267891 RepID=A0A4Q9JXA2_9BACT|nr:hypothetical protein [Campylobacter novaezeelandiae]QWU80147.1 hypothetical protein CNZW441b_0831 [Campylobacter novaezeelandiae]TBR78939.1 hypothetical protein DU474_04115 [Campylobacter novaezeelandiae]TBR81538.1 hypothetical protein DU472_02250 [Campylobacter novaezeelandiae]TBR82281.1 hypothetical protein DU473_00120 [Campylobacter novaezeelandiae]
MYEKKDLRILKIIQKAREFGDSDLLNENLVEILINSKINSLNQSDKNEFIKILNSIVEIKEKAHLSK